MRDCLSFDIHNEQYMFAYASLLIQLNRCQESIVLLKALLSKHFKPVQVQLLLAYAYK
jgi:predicted Zn-dependent protease